MAGDDDDLIGAVPAGGKVGRPTAAEALQKLIDTRQERGGPTALPRMEEFYKPVGVTFLADVFRLDARTVKKKLANCPAVGNEGGGRPLYDFVQAAGYLVKPKISAWDWVKSLRVQDLPPHLAPGIQSALLTRQTLETRAKQLWRTEDVMSVFGEVFLMLKDTMQLWAETMRENAGLTDEQWVRFRELVDDLQDQMHKKLVEMPKRRQTPNSLAHLDAEGAALATPFDEEAEDEE